MSDWENEDAEDMRWSVSNSRECLKGGGVKRRVCVRAGCVSKGARTLMTCDGRFRTGGGKCMCV